MLYAKYYIYLARCKNQQLCISVFRKKLQAMYRVHKQIAFSKNGEENFQADWRLILVFHKFIAFTKIKLCHCAQNPLSFVFLLFESSFKELPAGICKLKFWYMYIDKMTRF